MNARRNGFASRGAIATIGAAALVLAALVAVIGSAQAAPLDEELRRHRSTSPMRGRGETLTIAVSATLRIKLKTKRGASRRSARRSSRRPPASRSASDLSCRPDREHGLDRRVRGTASSRSARPSANRAHARTKRLGGCGRRHSAGCTDATWTTRAKQSNDFSGNPGTTSPATTRSRISRPLGSFDIDRDRDGRRSDHADRSRPARTADRAVAAEGHGRRHGLRPVRRCRVRRLRHDFGRSTRLAPKPARPGRELDGADDLRSRRLDDLVHGIGSATLDADRRRDGRPARHRDGRR